MGRIRKAFAGLSVEVDEGRNGTYVVLWGRFHGGLSGNLVSAIEGEEVRGTGIAKSFWEWGEEQVKAFV